MGINTMNERKNMTSKTRQPDGNRRITAPAVPASRVSRTRLNDTVPDAIGTANATAMRAIDILVLFSEESPCWSASEIALHFGMPKSTVYRYLNSLRSYALIEEDGRSSFRLGPRIFPLARTAKSGMSIVRIATPHLRALADAFGEMVVLQQRIGYDIVAVERIMSPQRVSLAYTRSHLLPWPATGSAKLLLALAPSVERDALMRMLQPMSYTGRTLETKSALRDALERIRKKGFAITDEERDEGVWGVAAPVREPTQVQYAVAIAAPKFRMTSAKISSVIDSVRHTAESIAKDLAATEF
jgi:DNA-binding IclR family transcriptional regulator